MPRRPASGGFTCPAAFAGRRRPRRARWRFAAGWPVGLRIRIVPGQGTPAPSSWTDVGSSLRVTARPGCGRGAPARAERGHPPPRSAAGSRAGRASLAAPGTGRLPSCRPALVRHGLEAGQPASVVLDHVPDLVRVPATGAAPLELSPPIVRPARVALLSSWSLPLAIAVRTAVGAACSRPAGRMAMAWDRPAGAAPCQWRRAWCTLEALRERLPSAAASRKDLPSLEARRPAPARAGRDLRAAVQESSCWTLIRLTVRPLPSR